MNVPYLFDVLTNLLVLAASYKVRETALLTLLSVKLSEKDLHR
jgi:hypothetical protein